MTKKSKSFELTNSVKSQKIELLKYFRHRASEATAEAERAFGAGDFKKKAKKVNTLLSASRETLISATKQKAAADKWETDDIFEGVMMITYCNYVAMLEARHSLWSYEYMAFSRRIGELWEPFCKLPFEYPANELELFIPPLFEDVKSDLSSEIADYINTLELSEGEREQLMTYYDKVWGLVTSGEIQLELDLHFKFKETKYVVDFKSGFGSNEKGNTNRLLLVASIYHNIEDGYQPLIFVRSADNNNYFTTLKESGVWQAFSGDETYAEICKYTGHDIKGWIDKNIKWEDDLEKSFVKHLKTNDLMHYLTW